MTERAPAKTLRQGLEDRVETMSKSLAQPHLTTTEILGAANGFGIHHKSHDSFVQKILLGVVSERLMDEKADIDTALDIASGMTPTYNLAKCLGDRGESSITREGVSKERSKKILRLASQVFTKAVDNYRNNDYGTLIDVLTDFSEVARSQYSIEDLEGAQITARAALAGFLEFDEYGWNRHRYNLDEDKRDLLIYLDPKDPLFIQVSDSLISDQTRRNVDLDLARR